MKITCGIWLVNKHNEILFVHPTYEDMKKYSIPKGIMDEGENELEAAKRELFEETSIPWSDIEGSVIDIIELGLTPYLNGKKSLKSFLVRTNSELNLDMRCDSIVISHKLSPFPEVDDFIWRDINNIEDLNFNQAHTLCFDEIKNILK